MILRQTLIDAKIVKRKLTTMHIHFVFSLTNKQEYAAD